MIKINKDNRLNFFVGVFQKTFPMSNVCLYGHPVVIRCSMTINKNDFLKNSAVSDFRKIFMIEDDQLEINYLSEDEKYIQLHSSLLLRTLDGMVCQVMHKYEQMFPCSFILNIFNNDNPLLNGKKVIVVPSVKAKEATRHILEEIIKSLDPSSELVDHHIIMNNYIDCIVDTLDEQCDSEYLPSKAIKFNNSDTTTQSDPIIDYHDLIMQKFDADSEQEEKIIEKEKVIECIGTSTLSGIIKSNDDFFIFTTGHGLTSSCVPKDNNYSLKDYVWPCSRHERNNLFFKSYGVQTDMIDYFTLSDVAVLEPKEGAIENFYKANKDNFVLKEFISEYKSRNPVVPDKSQIEGSVQYSGCITEGKMEIIGTAYVGREFSNTSGGVVELVSCYERFYLAFPDGTSASADVDGQGRMIMPPAGSQYGDSGSCVTMETTDGTSKIHSFLKGKMNDLNYRLLSPAHFVLEQIRKITDNPDAVFVSLIQKSITSFDTSQLEKSIRNITSQGLQFNSGRRNLLRQQNNVESSQTDTDDETNHSNVESNHADNDFYRCNCS